MHDSGALLKRAEQILAAALGRPLALVEPRVLKSWDRNDVVRARVAGAGGAPATVVVKRSKAQPACGLDDRAALDLLTRLGVDPPVAPRLLAGDRHLGRCTTVLAEAGRFPALAGSLGRQAVALGRRWPAEARARPGWPAFG